jgi:hypothetical protein
MNILTVSDIYTIYYNYIDQKTQFKKNYKKYAHVQFECRDEHLQGNVPKQMLVLIIRIFMLSDLNTSLKGKRLAYYSLHKITLV